MSGAPRTAQLVLGGRLDVADWAARHAAGEVPDAVPYGLDRMEPHGYRLDHRGPRWASTPPGHLVRGAARRLLGGYDWALVASPTPRADVVLSWDERAGAPLALAHGRRRPVVTNVIWATDEPASPALTAVVGAGLRRARGIFVHSSAQVAQLRERFGVDPAAVHPIALGVDADFFTALPRDLADPDHVVAVGNDRHRDWPTLLAAHRLVRRQRPATRLTIVSRTVDPALLAGVDGVELVPGLGHAPLHRLLGTAAVCAVLTRPNAHVSGATATLEALASGRPVVASDNPGMRDYAGGAVALVPVGDPEAAARALLGWLADPGAAADAGLAGRADVDAVFSTERHARRLAAVLDEVLT